MKFETMMRHAKEKERNFGAAVKLVQGEDNPAVVKDICESFNLPAPDAAEVTVFGAAIAMTRAVWMRDFPGTLEKVSSETTQEEAQKKALGKLMKAYVARAKARTAYFGPRPWPWEQYTISAEDVKTALKEWSGDVPDDLEEMDDDTWPDPELLWMGGPALDKALDEWAAGQRFVAKRIAEDEQWKEIRRECGLNEREYVIARKMAPMAAMIDEETHGWEDAVAEWMDGQKAQAEFSAAVCAYETAMRKDPTMAAEAWAEEKARRALIDNLCA